jgi:hypothetical protein
MSAFRLLRRVMSLTRGVFAGAVGRLEAQHPDAVYDAAIDRLAQQEERLREAIGRTAYLRSRVETAVAERSADLALVERALADAVRQPGDAPALALIQKKRELEQVIASQADRRRTLSDQIDTAKQHLGRLTEGKQRLRDERSEMLSRRTHAQVRRELRQIAEPLDPVIDEALENARGAIFQLEYVADLADARTDTDDVSIDALRRDAERAADAEALAALRRGAAV